MAFDIYGNHLRPGHCEVHPDVRGEYPCECCVDDYRAHQLHEQEPDIEPNYCEANGHPYHGDDSEGGRCECGERRFPFGGPAEAPTAEVADLLEALKASLIAPEKGKP
jgi:hypothetical protein